MYLINVLSELFGNKRFTIPVIRQIIIKIIKKYLVAVCVIKLTIILKKILTAKLQIPPADNASCILFLGISYFSLDEHSPEKNLYFPYLNKYLLLSNFHVNRLMLNSSIVTLNNLKNIKCPNSCMEIESNKQIGIMLKKYKKTNPSYFILL
jgi:hypothetical protein